MDFKEKCKKILLNKDKTLLMTVGDVHRLFGHCINNMIETKGVSNTYNAILFHLSKNDSLTQVELVNRTHLRASTVSVALQKMEVEGLIKRVSNDIDKRCLTVSITDDGKKLFDKTHEYIHEFDLELTKDINQEELEITKKVLQELIIKMIGEDR